MIRTKFIYLSILCISFLSVNCTKFLDVIPEEFHQEDDLFTDIIQAEREIAVLYRELPIYYWNGFADLGYSMSSDEAYTNTQGLLPLRYIRGNWSASDNPLTFWGTTYQNVRRAYHFLENVDKVNVLNADVKSEYTEVIIPRYKKEVKFLLAFYYFQSYIRHGSVPLVKKWYPVSEIEELLKIPRSTESEVVDYMLELLDEALEGEQGKGGLSDKYSDDEMGRATRGAAMALKAKILLYSASPLFNGGEIDGNSVIVDGKDVKNTLLSVKNFDGKPLYNTTYDREKWKLAADATKELLDYGMGLYSLNAKQSELFMTRNFTEAIWHKQMGFSTNFEAATAPTGTDYGGNGYVGPTQEMVDSYEMITGIPIANIESGYVESGWVDTVMNVFRNRQWSQVNVRIRSMYHRRDPRFYTDIFYNGMPYLHRNVITEFVQGDNPGTNHDGAAKPGTATLTGYYVQKWCDPEQTLRSMSKNIARNYPYFRLAEVYLWYAEAMNEYLDQPDIRVYDAINKVRDRVGMPLLPIIPEDYTKAGMRKRIQNERKIELAYEGHRFWDIRRWLIAHTPESTTLTGLNILGSGENFYKRTAISSDGRQFRVHHYLMPISSYEINKAPDVLVQGYGW